MNNNLITHKEPKSPISECFRALRTNIQFKNSKKELKTILITSTIQSEGKSTVVANLAITFAQAGKRTIIVDADLRRTRQHKIFGISQKPGLSNYLLGIDDDGNYTNQDLSEYIKETEIENLSILPAGTIPPNPSELLASDITINMMNKLKQMYDIIIFDGTPCVLVTDAIILSRIVDTTIILASYKETKMDNLRRIKKDIENVGGNIAGVILNKFPISKGSYSSKYYYGHSEDKFKEVDITDAICQQRITTDNIEQREESDTKNETSAFTEAFVQVELKRELEEKVNITEVGQDIKEELNNKIGEIRR